MNNIEENRLEHSSEALNITHKFYDKKFMLYVEGDDDVVFWDENFRKYMSKDFYEIEQVNGKENLARYITGITDGILSNIVVACDADYSEFMDENFEHKFIIRTYGHSIENTMFCPHSVATYIRRASKTSNDYLPDVLEWLSTFCLKAKKLLPYEIENEYNPTHCETLPKIFNKGFYYFQDNQNKGYLDDNKIDSYLKSISSTFNSDRISEITQRVNDSDKEVRYLIQGHFIAKAIMEYMRESVKQIKGNINAPNEAIYESFMDCKCTCNPLCKDKLFLKAQIEKVLNHFTEIS